MRLKKFYLPVKKELIGVEEVLKESLKNTRYKSIREITNYLLGAGGKRLRPALVLLSAKAGQDDISAGQQQSICLVAAAVELIHMASLIHDDVIDHATMRHNKPTVNSRWDNDVSIALGDYLYSEAFRLISNCGNPDIIQCISSATKAMCEGELLQVCERDNLNLSVEKYILIVKKKTASLFAASCHAGAMVSKSRQSLQKALKGFGLNFGIAFQIMDDYMDLAGEKKMLGKTPGQDIRAGEITLPLLNVLESVSEDEREKLEMLLASNRRNESLQRIRSGLLSPESTHKTKKAVSTYITLAKKNLNELSESPYKKSLINLAEWMIKL